MTQIHWATSTKEAFLLNHTVNIWKIDYSTFSGEEETGIQILNTQEQIRAQKFHFQTDRKRFRVTRALLKIILSQITGKNPADITFSYNQHGKPYLEDNLNINFNVSHSGNTGLIAISDLGPLGTDVEKYRNRIDTDKMARRFFSEQEQEAFLKIADRQKLQGFFYGWTRKEALIKALGLGLAMPLKSFDVTLTPGQPARLLDIRHKDEQARDWTIKDIHLAGEYAAAFAVKAKDFNYNFWSPSGLIQFNSY